MKDPGVECHVSFPHSCAIAMGCRRTHGGDNGIKLLNELGILLQALHGIEGSAALNIAPDLRELNYARMIKINNAGASVGLQDDDALLGEHLKSRAHGKPTDFKFSSDLFLYQSIAGQETTLSYATYDAFGDLLGEALCTDCRHLGLDP